MPIYQPDQNSVTSNEVSVISNAVSAVSHRLSVLSNQNSVEHANLSDRIDLGGGTASVTSDEVSAVSAQAASALSQAVSVISQALSVLSQANSVAHAALSARIDTQSQGISVLSQQVSALSQVVSALSQANSVAHAALSVRIDTQSQSVSALSQQVSLLSAAHSALSQAHSVLSNVVSNELSVRSAADAALSVRIDTQSQSISVISQQVSALSQAHSVLSNTNSAEHVTLSDKISVASAAATSADGHANTASAAATSVNSRVNSVNTFISGISARSVGDVSTHGLQSVINALSNVISATVAAGGVSVTSNEVSAVSATAHAALSERASALSHAISVVSQAASAAEAHASTASAAATSVNSRVNSVNTFVSGISSRSVGDVSTHGFQSVVDALSNRISAGGGSGSVTSNELSHEASVRSAADAALSVRVDTQSQSISAISQQVSALSQALSALSNTNSAEHVTLSDKISVASAAATSVNSRVNSVNTFISSISARSAGDVSTHGFQSVVNALSNRISAGGAAASVTSNELSHEASVRSAADAALSVRVDTQSQSISAISQQVSLLSHAHSALSQAVSVMSVDLGYLISLQNLDSVTLSAGHVVRAWTSADTMKRIMGNDAFTTPSPIVGIIRDSAIAVSAVGRVQTQGVISLATATWDERVSTTGGLVPGTVYMLDQSALGQITPAVSSEYNTTRIGLALTPTRMRLQIGHHNDLMNYLSAQFVLISILSDQVSVVSNAVSVVSHAVSVLSQANSAAHVVLSDKISVASAAATSADGHANTASAAATSVNSRVNSVNTFISGISARSVGGVSTHGLQSVIDALSNVISATVVAGGVSVTSTELSAAGAALSVRIDTVSNNLSVLSAEVGWMLSLQNLDSVTLSAGNPVRAWTSADTMKRIIMNDWATTPAPVLGLIKDGSIAVSAVGRVQTQGILSLDTALWDARTGGSGGLTPGVAYFVDDVTLGAITASVEYNSQRIGTAVSPTKMLLQVGHHNDLMNYLSLQFARISVLSARTLSAAPAKRVTGAQTMGAIADVSGLSISVSAGGLYELQGYIAYNCQTTSTPRRFGMSFPAANMTRGRIFGPLSATGGASAATSAGAFAQAVWEGDSASNSVVFSVVPVAPVSSIAFLSSFVRYEGVFAASVTGTIQLRAGCSAGLTLTVLAGSYIRLVKIA